MAYNLVTLSATVDSDIQHIDLGSGKYVALFKVKYYSARQPCTITIAAFDNVTDYVEKALREGSEILIKGNLTQYNDETEIIANSIDSYDASGRVVRLERFARAKRKKLLSRHHINKQKSIQD